jgi:hypothetical protein
VAVVAVLASVPVVLVPVVLVPAVLVPAVAVVAVAVAAPVALVVPLRLPPRAPERQFAKRFTFPPEPSGSGVFLGRIAQGGTTAIL